MGLVDGHPAIAWQPVAGVVAYDVLRATLTPAGWFTIRSAISSPTEFVDMSVSGPASSSYVYRVIAHCPAGPPVYADIRIGAPQVSLPACH